MISRIIILAFLTVIFSGSAGAQAPSGTADLFKRTDPSSGSLNIVQAPLIDTLLGRYIMMNKKIYDEYGIDEPGYGMYGYRIQIYNSSSRNAREESSKTISEFVNLFPDIEAYKQYSQPAYFKVRVGDFRTKTEATKFLIGISRVFPNAYLVPDYIRFPELNKK